MINSEIMNLNLTRGNVCDVLRAITSVRIDFIREIKDENTTDDRSKIAESSLAMWEKLHSEIKEQLNKFDESKQAV